MTKGVKVSKRRTNKQKGEDNKISGPSESRLALLIFHLPLQILFFYPVANTYKFLLPFIYFLFPLTNFCQFQFSEQSTLMIVDHLKVWRSLSPASRENGCGADIPQNEGYVNSERGKIADVYALPAPAIRERGRM